MTEHIKQAEQQKRAVYLLPFSLGPRTLRCRLQSDCVAYASLRQAEAAGSQLLKAGHGQLLTLAVLLQQSARQLGLLLWRLGPGCSR